MDWRWIFLLLLWVLTDEVENKEVIAQINTKRLIHYVPERFLSMTIDPTSLFMAGKLEQQALKMARGLYPSFVRLGGQATNYLKFGKELFVDNSTITEDQWDGVYKFVQEADLDLIVSLNPTHRVQGVWDSRDALQLISYSDEHGYNVAWQLGYDTVGQLAPGDEVGRDIVRLRKILDGFQRYARTPLFGPDLPQVKSSKDTAFIRDMLAQASPVLGAIVIQMPFSINENPSTAITNTLLNMDNHIWSRDLRFGRSLPKKPIWLADQYPSSGSVEEAISLAKHLGYAAQIGCQIMLRQVGPESLKCPTPEYWLSVIYKNLVGRGVFDIKVNSGNRSEIVLFSHCSQSLPQEKSMLDTGFNYGKGAVTVFGVNESPETVKLSLKASMKDEKVHLYILTFQDDPFDKTEKTFLNGQLLTLSPSGDLPIISPKIKRTIKYGINMPARSIFFMVLPELKAKSCISPNPLVSSDVQSLSKKLIHVVANVLDKPTNDDLRSEEEDPKAYVKFTKSIDIPSLDQRPLQASEDSEPDIQVKYITFNDNSWLSKLTETMGNSKVDEHVDDNQNSGNEDRYAVLSSAITGSYNFTDLSEDNLKPLAKRRRRRSFSDKTQIPGLDVASQEELVKHLNQYASNVYKTSQSDGSEKEIQIANIPPQIFNTLKQVKVTFKNLGTVDSEETLKKNTNKNELSIPEETGEESKETAPLNSFLMSSDGTINSMILDGEKSHINPKLIKSKELNNYNEETSQNNERVPKEISGKEEQNSEVSAYLESNDGIDTNTNPFSNTESIQEKGTYSIPIPEPQGEHSLEVIDKSQEELQEQSDGKETTQRSKLENIEINDEEASFKNTKLAIPETPISERKDLEDESKNIGDNYVLKNIQLLSTPTEDNGLEEEKNLMLVPVKAMESEITPNIVALESKGLLHGNNEQLTAEYNENKKENHHEPSKTSEIRHPSFNQNLNDGFHNEEDEQEKVTHVADNTEKESQPTENKVLPEEIYVKENEGEKINQIGNYFEDEQLLRNVQEFPLNSEKTSSINAKTINQGPSEDQNTLPLIVPMVGEDLQQGLEGGPPLPSYDSETIKVQRDIPLDEEIPENIAENNPLVIVPINMESEVELQENNKSERENKNPLENLSINTNGEDNPEVIEPDNLDKELSNNDRDRKDISEILKEENDPINSSYAEESLINPMKPPSETQVASFENMQLENSGDKSYEKTSDSLVNDNQNNLLSNLESQIPLASTMEEIQTIQNIPNGYPDKSTNTKISEKYLSQEIPVPMSIVAPETALEQLEKENYSTKELPDVDSLPIKISQIPDEKTELSAHEMGYEKNIPEFRSTEEKGIARHKLLSKIMPRDGSESNKKPDMIYKPDISKADYEKDRRERLLSLKKQIMEIREQFRAQVREEGLKIALQKREEEMRNYLNHDKELKKKFLAYPLMDQDHNVLSRQRRLSYYPDSEIADEDLYDYIDQKAYKKRTDSYGMPILDDYDKPYLHQQIISSPRNSPDHNHILFPLDPKTSQALVLDDTIIPAKLFGIISVNDEPSGIKNANVANKPITDLPIDSIYQKCCPKHYDLQPVTKEKHVPTISETSLPLDTYSLPRNSYIKGLDERTNYIPIVVLSSNIKNHRRKRSVTEDITDRESAKKENDIIWNTALKKRSIQPITPFENNAFQDRSYDFLNEIPTETDNHINSVEYIHPNEIIISKSNEVNKLSKRYPEYLPTNNAPMGYIQSEPNLYNSPPIWNDVDKIEPRHYLPPPHPPLLVHHDITEQQTQEKHLDSPKFYFWSMMHDKFKSMLELLQSLAEWCSGSSDK